LPVPAFQEGQHKLVLGGEVAIEARLGHPGTADQFIDANASDAAPGEQLIGDSQNSLTDTRRDTNTAIRDGWPNRRCRLGIR
jgi:hypothetical protein